MSHIDHWVVQIEDWSPLVDPSCIMLLLDGSTAACLHARRLESDAVWWAISLKVIKQIKHRCSLSNIERLKEKKIVWTDWFLLLSSSSLKFTPLQRAETLWRQASEKDESKIIIVLSAAKGGAGGWGLLRWMLFHQNINSQSFSGLWQKPVWLKGTVWQQVVLQSLFKSTHPARWFTKQKKEMQLICMIYMLHRRSSSPPPPTYVTENPITAHSPPSSSHTRFLSPSRHSKHSTKRDLSCTRRHPRTGERQSANRLRRMQDYAVNLKNDSAPSGGEGAEIWAPVTAECEKSLNLWR